MSPRNILLFFGVLLAIGGVAMWHNSHEPPVKSASKTESKTEKKVTELQNDQPLEVEKLKEAPQYVVASGVQRPKSIPQKKIKKNPRSPLQNAPRPIPESDTENFVQSADISRLCAKDFKKFPHTNNLEASSKICMHVRQLKGCQSVKGRPIYHYERQGRKKGNRILSISLVHGDEV